MAVSRLKQSTLSSLTTTNRNKTLEKSLEEQVYEMEIHNIEAERLKRTFHRICGNPGFPSSNNEQDQFRKEKE